MKSTCILLISVFTHVVLEVSSIRLAFFNETDLGSTTPTTVPWPDNVSCDFDEYSMCGWKQVPWGDSFDWRLGDGKDSHRKRKRGKGTTGTKNDHGGGGGYMYIKAGRWSNRTALLRTSGLHLVQDGCLKFWYHMRGRHMGHLKLYTKDVKLTKSPIFFIPQTIKSFQPRWGLYGSQGGTWKQGVVPIKHPKYPKEDGKVLVFEAFDWDKGPNGNIVLDDITFDPLTNPNDCILSPPEASPPAGATTTRTIPVVTSKTTKVLTSTRNIAYTTTATTQTTPITTSKTLNASISSTLIGTTGKDNLSTTVATSPIFAISSSTSLISSWSTAILSTLVPSMVKNNSTGNISNQSKTKRTTIPTATIRITSKNQRFINFTELFYINSTKPSRKRNTNSTVFLPGISTKPSTNVSVAGAAVGIIIAVLLLVVAALWFLRNKKRRRFSYYDNSTVHMTRMSPTAVDTLDTSMVYRKL